MAVGDHRDNSMRRLLYNAMMLLTALLFIGVSVLALYLQGKQEKSVDYLYRTNYWHMGQLVLESQRFCDGLRLYRAGALSRDDLTLLFDLLWNRVDIFLVSEESAELRRQGGMVEATRSLFDNLKRLAPRIDGGELGPGPMMDELVERVTNDIRRIEVLEQEALTGEQRQSSVQHIRRDLRWLQISQLLLLLAGMVLVLALCRANDQNRRLSLLDPLTRLGNRRAFYQALGSGLCHERVGALVILDLKRFKQVNDQLGYQVGDRLLQVIAQRLGDWPYGTAYRLGGDEFALVMPPAESAGLSERVKEIPGVIGEPFITREQRLIPRCRLGVALAGGSDEVSNLIDHAIQALDQAKRGDLGDLVFFERRLAERLLLRQQRSQTLLQWLHQGGMSPLEHRFEPLQSAGEVSALLLYLRWLPQGEHCEPEWLDEVGMLEQVVLPHAAMLWQERGLPLMIRLHGVTQLIHLLDGLALRQEMVSRVILSLPVVGEWDEQLKERVIASGVALAVEEIGSATARQLAEGWPIRFWLSLSHQGQLGESLLTLSRELGLTPLDCPA